MKSLLETFHHSQLVWKLTKKGFQGEDYTFRPILLQSFLNSLLPSPKCPLCLSIYQWLTVSRFLSVLL